MFIFHTYTLTHTHICTHTLDLFLSCALILPTNICTYIAGLIAYSIKSNKSKSNNNEHDNDDDDNNDEHGVDDGGGIQVFNTTTNGTKIEEDEVPDITDPFFLIETICIIWFTFELSVR